MTDHRYPASRLEEHADDIRAMVRLAREQGLVDDDVTVFVNVHPVRGTTVTFARRQNDDVLYFVNTAHPGLAADYALRRPGHVTVIVIAPEGAAVFGVKIAARVVA